MYHMLEPHVKDRIYQALSQEHGHGIGGECTVCVGRTARVMDIVGPLIPNLPTRHVLQIDTDGWTLEHPISCRMEYEHLADCPVNRAGKTLTGNERRPGRYEVVASPDEPPRMEWL